MITVLAGENSFENERALSRIVSDFEGQAERVDGEVLELKQLPDLLMGMSLFATKRLVVIKNMSANKTLWNAFEDWMGKVSDDIHLVLVEPKPDKRTRTYKALRKAATVVESKLWSERDKQLVEKWVIEEAKRQGVPLDKKSAHTLVEYVGLDQWQLFHSLQKLAVLGEVSPGIIEEVIEKNPAENVFGLFEAALKGNTIKVRNMLKTLETTEDAFKVFGLLGSQAFQLALLASTTLPSSAVAADAGVHPFVLQKLAPFAKAFGKGGAKKVVGFFAEADKALKTTSIDPWLLIERALLKTAESA